MIAGFNTSLFQIRIGYQHFRGKPLPGNLPFVAAGDGLILDFGRKRVEAVLKAIPNDASEAAALESAQAADQPFQESA